MAMFVHLTPESRARSVRQNGLLVGRRGRVVEGIFALPVTRNFYLSHQWVRELRRRNSGPIVGVYFRIPDEEIVNIGHYGKPHEQMSAAQAAAVMMSCESREGYEVIIPRSIPASAIHRIRRLPQMVGWRYYPGAHGSRPCGCDYCQSGLYGARKLREAYQNA